MKITEIKKWAKDMGYIISKSKINDQRNEYIWSKLDDPSICGQTYSLSKAATAIYNHISNYQWIQYQKEYQENKVIEQFNISDYGS